MLPQCGRPHDSRLNGVIADASGASVQDAKTTANIDARNPPGNHHQRNRSRIQAHRSGGNRAGSESICASGFHMALGAVSETVEVQRRSPARIQYFVGRTSDRDLGGQPSSTPWPQLRATRSSRPCLASPELACRRRARIAMATSTFRSWRETLMFAGKRRTATSSWFSLQPCRPLRIFPASQPFAAQRRLFRRQLRILRAHRRVSLVQLRPAAFPALP